MTGSAYCISATWTVSHAPCLQVKAGASVSAGEEGFSAPGASKAASTLPFSDLPAGLLCNATQAARGLFPSSCCGEKGCLPRTLFREIRGTVSSASSVLLLRSASRQAEASAPQIVCVCARMEG